MDKDQAKSLIIDAFKNNVLGTKPSAQELQLNHDGTEGHWLEVKLGKKPDASNEPDFWGYECKADTTSKTTWGDWTANYRIFNDSNYFTEKTLADRQNKFVTIFGSPNPKKNGRYSWSGKPVPSRHGDLSENGQSLNVDMNLDVSITYSYSLDQRPDKQSHVPSLFKKENLLLMKWFGYEGSFQSYKITAQNDPNLDFHFSQKSLESKVLSKFGKYGWFKCLKDKNGIYQSLAFGDSLNYQQWIDQVLKGSIYYDAGPYVGNVRPYSMWRSDNTFGLP